VQLRTSREYLCAGTSGASSQGPNRGSLSAAGDGPNDGAEKGSAAEKLSGAFIRADSFPLASVEYIFGVEYVPATLHANGP